MSRREGPRTARRPLLRRRLAGPRRQPLIAEVAGLLRDCSLLGMAEKEAALHDRFDTLAMEMRLTLLAAYADFIENVEQRLLSSGLTHGMFLVLTALRDNSNQPLTMGQLAERMLTKPRNVTPLVDALSEAGLVLREPLESDRRVILINLTAEGAALLDDFLPRFFGALDSVSRSFADEEKLAVIHGLNKLRRSIAVPNSSNKPR
jgi:MarR family transcriptional regulator, negative regulator of the multidrug operon emrRAB